MVPTEDLPAREVTGLGITEEGENEGFLAGSSAFRPKKALPVIVAAVVGLVLVAVGGTSASKMLTMPHSEGDELVLAGRGKGRFPWGFVEREVCGVDYKIVHVVHNNLGGQGPDKGEEGIIYKCSESINNRFVRHVHVKVNALSPYHSKSAHKNGHHFDFGSIRVDSGKHVDVRFSIWTTDDKPITAKEFRVTFYDLDEGPHGTSVEYVVVDDRHPKEETDGKSTEVKEKEKHGKDDFLASRQGSGSDNPRDSEKLTQEQKDRSVVLDYKNVHSFETTLGASQGHSARNFAFALHSALACHEKKFAITTTATTTATTTTTITTTTPPPTDWSWLWILLALLALLGAIIGLLLCCCAKRSPRDALPPGYPLGNS